MVALEDYVTEGRGGNDPRPTMIMRHDVDQHPGSALAMGRIDREMGVPSSWYFRWRTAHPVVIAILNHWGFQIGLHYETLTRLALARGIAGPPDERLIAEARRRLREEISAFSSLHGPIRSVVPHGDSRLPEIHNATLLRGEDCASYGVEFDGKEAMRGRGLAHWLTDRTAAEGRWTEGFDPTDLFAGQASPILCVTHPNNWESGPRLWWDRALRLVMPDQRHEVATEEGVVARANCVIAHGFLPVVPLTLRPE